MTNEWMKNMSEAISSNRNSAEIIDHTCYDNENISVNTEEEVDVTCINYINETNKISTSDDDNYIHKYYALFLLSKIHKYASSGTEYNSTKRRVRCQKNVILDLLLN